MNGAYLIVLEHEARFYLRAQLRFVVVFEAGERRAFVSVHPLVARIINITLQKG
jgi:hypothetical protein